MEANKKWIWIVPVLAAAISLFFFGFLYRYDNKYTAKGSQPIQGVLMLSEEELNRHQIHFPIYDWEFYPGELLTPADFQNGAGGRYHRYISIGQYSGMEMGRVSRSPHGSGTYRLTLELPETPDSYALEIPEIYSAYRLYLNEELLLQMGDPDPASFQPGIQKRVLSFRGGGSVQLIVAVSDYAHFYSGMVYPISFGKNVVIQTMRGVRILIHGVLLTFVVMVAAVSTHLFLRSRSRINLLYALLAICLAGYTSYPSLLVSFFTVGLQPWYTIQLFCYYMMIPLVILIYQWLLQDQQKRITAVAAVFLVLGVGESLCSAFIGKSDQFWMMELYSLAGTGIKWLSALTILGLSAYLVFRRTLHSAGLFAGAVCYACSVFADRLFPIFEPILGGWFMEMGGMVLLAVLNGILWKKLMEAYRFQMTFSEHERQMRQMISVQQEHYARLADRIQETRRLRHDMRQHMRILNLFAQDGELEKIREYLKEYAGDTEQLQAPLVLSENMTADAILKYYQTLSAQRKVRMTIKGNLPNLEGISDIDISVLLGNLLENALDAQKLLPVERREVACQIQVVNQKLTILVQNPYRGKIREKEGCFYSTKHEGLGIGTGSVRLIAEKYGGYADYTCTSGVFKAMVFLNVYHTNP